MRQVVINSNVRINLDLYVTRAALATSADSGDHLNSIDSEEKEKSGASTPVRDIIEVAVHYGRPDILNIIRMAISECPGKTLVVGTLA